MWTVVIVILVLAGGIFAMNYFLRNNDIFAKYKLYFNIGAGCIAGFIVLYFIKSAILGSMFDLALITVVIGLIGGGAMNVVTNYFMKDATINNAINEVKNKTQDALETLGMYIPKV